jgi:hypothetical protein
LPVPVISFHVLLGATGLELWISYLLLDDDGLAWAAGAALGAVAVLGLIMAARWIGVYRTFSDPGPPLTRSNTAPPPRPSAPSTSQRWADAAVSRAASRCGSTASTVAGT